MTGRAGPSAGCPLRESVLPVSLTVTSRLVRPVGDLPIHCKIIRIHCNAIQTLLQLNSNNSNQRRLFAERTLCKIAGGWEQAYIGLGNKGFRQGKPSVRRCSPVENTKGATGGSGGGRCRGSLHRRASPFRERAWG